MSIRRIIDDIIEYSNILGMFMFTALCGLGLLQRAEISKLSLVLKKLNHRMEAEKKFFLFNL